MMPRPSPPKGDGEYMYISHKGIFPDFERVYMGLSITNRISNEPVHAVVVTPPDGWESVECTATERVWVDGVVKVSSSPDGFTCRGVTMEDDLSYETIGIATACVKEGETVEVYRKTMER